jgi:Asp-tRNA(Asn)/Glu-tRNA(Gln) amidotransferase C subunit
MTREAVEEGFHEFVGDIVDRTYEEFDVVAVLRGGTSASGRLVSTLLKNAPALERTFVRPELRKYKQDVYDQIEVVLDYAEDPDADPADYREAMLEHDTYYDHLRPDLPEEKRAEIADLLVERQVALGDAARPLVASDAETFWAAVEAELSYEEAVDLVQSHFEFTEPARDHPDAFRFASKFDASEVVGNLFSLGMPRLRVDYTDEVVRAMHEAERETIESVLAEVEQRYD